MPRAPERVAGSAVVDLPRPDPGLPHLADVVPSVLAALGAPDFERRIPLRDGIAGAGVLLIDGLGAELLDTYADDAPVLAGLFGQTLSVGFPSTTAAGLAAVGTGCRSGEHGMVGVGDVDRVDLDQSAALLDGVSAIGGEARARHVYTDDGAAAAVLQTWRETLGDRAWVVSRDEAIAAGWFGERIADSVRQRIGDVVAAGRDSTVMVRRTVEPVESGLVGHHGSLTAAEQYVPLLLAYG